MARGFHQKSMNGLSAAYAVIRNQMRGHEDDIVIGWKEIEVIGEETILVNHTMPCCEPRKCKKRGGIMDGIFGGR